MKRVLFVALWVVASVIATSMALAAVSSVTNDVTDSPGATLAAPDPSTTSTTSGGDSITTSTAETPGSTTTSTTEGPDTTTTTLPDNGDDDGAGSTTSTTTPSDDDDDDDHDTTTTTTDAPVTTETRTYQLQGGWVKVAIGPGVVDLVGAAPAPGFTMDVDTERADRVEVRFKSEDHKSDLDVRWDGGELIVDIDEEPEGEDSDDG